VPWSVPADALAASPSELRIDHDDDVPAETAATHLMQERRERIVECLQQRLMWCALVGVGVEIAQRRHVSM
jgi:hypothetical protein